LFASDSLRFRQTLIHEPGEFFRFFSVRIGKCALALPDDGCDATAQLAFVVGFDEVESDHLVHLYSGLLQSYNEELVNDRPGNGRATEEIAEREASIVNLKIRTARQQLDDRDRYTESEKGCDEETDPLFIHTHPYSGCDKRCTAEK
jgi:hypothetical protein